MAIKIKYRKAVFFSLDALIALSIILLIILIAYPIIKITRQETEVHYDVIKTLSSLKIGEIDNAYVKSLILAGEINNTNRSLLEQIGEFYVTDINKAKDLANAVLGGLNTSRNLGIWYGNTLIASINSTPYEKARDIEIARQIISGIKEGGNVTGFSARAFLTSSQKTSYTYFGGYIGDGNITIRTEYDGDISSATIELTINNDFQLYINGISSGNYLKSDDDFTPKTYSIPTQNFISGTNLLDIKGQNLHVAGGFVKITYDTNVTQNLTKYYFPGIRGLINIYDGFYIPGILNSLEIFLHMNSPYITFLTIGNTTVFNDSTTGEETITLTNSYLQPLLDYNGLSKKTIPIRFGLENATYITTGTAKSDVISVTDLSGSMLGTKIASAKQANIVLIDTILNYSGNRVGLAGYDTLAKKSDYHQLSNNSASLKNIVDNVWDADGWTCICCGILKAISCYEKSIFQDNFNNQAIGTNPIGWTISESGGSIDITSASLEGNRGVVISRTSSSNPDMHHQFPPQENDVSIEFLVNHTIGSGRIKIDIEHREGIGSFNDYIVIKMYGGQIRNNDAIIMPYNLNELYKIKIQVVPGSSTYNLYVNDAIVGSNLPVFATHTNIGRIRFTTETSTITYIIDDIKVYLNEDLCTNIDPQNKTRSAIVMSDGQANAACGLDPVPDHDNDADITNDPQDHAIEAACRAYTIYNITTHAVGFGSGADQTTLQRIAQCGNGTYNFGDVNNIVDIYKQIAENIIKTSYKEQTIEAVGNITTTLYPDSYIKFDYQKEQTPYGLIITTEKMFDNTFSGTLSIPQSSSVVETRVTSYSGPRWTNQLKVNNVTVYNLSQYGSDYIKLGDPYVIHIPNSFINITQNNIINLTTGTSPSNQNASSIYNKIISTILKNATGYSKISPNINGCIWKIQFEDNTNITLAIPSSYMGVENCYYTENQMIHNENDASQNAVYSLLQALDLDENKKIDIKFTQQDLQIDLTEIVGIPYTWSTEVQVRIWF